MGQKLPLDWRQCGLETLMPANNEVLQNGEDRDTPWYPLRCGPLTLSFDPALAALRTICLGEREVVRTIYVAVRDRNWGTVAPRITDLNLVTGADSNAVTPADSFRLTFTVQCQARDIDFAWRAEIVGAPNGTLRFQMEGEALSTFERNRIGFCILHPIRECAGQPCLVTAADGATQQGAFPDLVAPHQPFINMTGIRHEAQPGLWADLRFEGETFEMEDQRNWTDASYKTYCTPLSWPYPVTVQQGTRVSQSVTLTLQGGLPAPAAASTSADEPVILRLSDAPPVQMPEIGLGMASHGIPLTEREIECLRRLALAHLRLDLNLSAPEWEQCLQQAVQEATALGTQLEIALFLAADGLNGELATLANSVERLCPPVARWLIFDTVAPVTPESHLRAALAALAPLTPEAPFGGGTNAYFAQLNRNRPHSDLFDFVCWSANPQVHAFDTPSLMENLEAQAETVRTAHSFCGERPLVISPITLKPRFNPDATGPEPAPQPGELPAQVDARQAALSGAAWTLGSLKALCESGAHSVTYYETTGSRGVMETQTGSPLPERFPSVPGGIFPLYEVFFALSKAIQVLPLESRTSSKIIGIAFTAPETKLLCANLTAQVQTARLLLPSGADRVHVWQMDAHKIRLKLLPPDYSADDPGETVEVPDGVLERRLPPYALLLLEWDHPDNTQYQTPEHLSPNPQKESHHG